MIQLRKLLSEIISDEFDNYYNNLSKREEIYCLTESPAIVNKINMNIFDDNASNYDYTQKTKQYGQIVDVYKEYTIYRFTPTNDKNNINDVFVSNDLAYVYFNYTLKDGFIYEKKIWQDRYNFGLFRDIMFNYYLKKYKGIVSDSILSIKGENYWKKILKFAKTQGFKTYVLKNDTDIIPLNNLDDISMYKNISYKYVIET